MATYSDIYLSVKDRIQPLQGVYQSAEEDYQRLPQPAEWNDALAVDYGLNIQRLNIQVNPYQVFHCDVPGIQSYLYFVINDIFYHEQSARNQSLPHGVIICSMREATERHADLVRPYLGKLMAAQTDSFVALNAMFAQDGFFIYVPDGVQLEYPIQIINVLRSDVDLMANAHNLVVVGKNAKASLLVCDHTMDGKVRFCENRVTEVFVEEGAQYEHYKLEDTSELTNNLTSLFVSQAASSDALVNIITLRNGQTRNKIIITQEGDRAVSTLCGMAVALGKQVVDNFTRIEHRHIGGKSEELVKYVLDGQAKGNFTGELKVLPNAQQTEAYQTNRNILLSADAKVRTRPQLEIYADNVKCSHGATTGQIDETALFYMQQRCISLEEAHLLLMNAFLADVVGNIRVPSLQERIATLVDKRLRKADDACAGCRESHCK